MADRKAQNRAQDKAPNYPGLIDRLTRQVSRVADALERLEEHARPERWYQVTWVQGNPYGGPSYQHDHPDPMMKRSALAMSAEAAKAVVVDEQKKSHYDESLMRDVKVTVLGLHQCKYCCSVNWAEDATHCNRCGHTDQDAVEGRAQGRHHW